MESRKEVKKKINVFEAMHYIMDAWQQITQQTIQNCFRKAEYKYQSNVNEMANDDGGDDDFGQYWEELCGAQKYDFQNYVSVDCDVATSGVSTVEELCEACGSTRSVEEKNKKGERSPYNRPRRAQRGSRGIALLILDLGARRVWVVSTTPRPLYPQEIPGTHCTGGWVGPRAGLDVCEKSCPTGIRSPDHPARSQSLYRLCYPAHGKE
jgi:hypothetical protein